MGFDSDIEEELQLRILIAVDLDMSESSVVASELSILAIDLLAQGIPPCVEVQAGEEWFHLVEVVNQVLGTVGHDIWARLVNDH